MTGAILKKAIEQTGKPLKAIAKECGYSVDAIYAAINEKRRIPQGARRKLSEINPLAGLAVALESTGYTGWFGYIEGDRHPQTMLRRVEKEDAEADEAIKSIALRLIDKNSPEDLTPEDKVALHVATKELSERIKADINLLIEWENLYQLGLLVYLAGDPGQKEKALGSVAETRAAYEISHR